MNADKFYDNSNTEALIKESNEHTKLLEAIVNKNARKMSMKIDRYVKLHIQPKPRWLPDFIWKRILKRLLVLEELVAPSK